MKYLMMTFGFVAGSVFPAQAQTFGVEYITEMQYSPTSRKANWCNLIRTNLSLPIGNNGEFDAATIHIYKARQQRVVDDRLTFSNIEEQNNPFAIALLGYTQKIGSSALFLGVRNMNEDYFTSPVTSLFTNSSCGIYPTLSTNYPIANYPLSALCLDYKGRFGSWEIEGSLYNGVGHNGWSRRDNPFRFNCNQDGVFGITQINYQTNDGMYFCGASVHSSLFLRDENTMAQPSEATTSENGQEVGVTWWSYAEQRLWAGAGHEINLLAQYSQNSSVDNYCKRYAGLGVTWGCRDGKQRWHDAGVVFSVAQFGGTYEATAEMTYRYQFSPNGFLQPAVHLIKNNTGFHSVCMLRIKYVIDWRLK